MVAMPVTTSFPNSLGTSHLMIITIIVVLCILTLAMVAFLRVRRCPGNSKPLVQVVVLGDIGHSPRMQYHTLALVETGKVCVELIGFRGSKPIASITDHPDVTIRYVRPLFLPPSWRVPFAIYAIMKVIVESVQLFSILVSSKYRSEFILVQTPPALPSVAVCAAVSLLSGSHLVLDFHNITYMHLESKLKNKIIINLVKLYERLVSRFASTAFCVTKSMKTFLCSQFGLESVYTLYDRPGPQFTGRTTPAAKADLESRLLKQKVLIEPFSAYNHIIVSSTSWTPDEDFTLVLAALPEFSKRTTGQRSLLFITGKGELKNEFVAKFSSLNLKNIDLVTAWLAAGDYPLVLGVADVGVSVHTSTSGLDLPMKAVDMLGCEVPVIALKFPALSELLGNGDAGLTFTSGSELADALALLTVGNGAKEKREKMIKFAAKWRKETFKSEWMNVAWPVLEKFVPRRSRQSRRRD